MRLIDKDRLLKGSNHYWLEMENFGDIEAIDVRFIEMADEVKAIPVKWIDGYIKRRANDVNIYAEILFISDMVKEWEKENETNR